MSNKRGSGSKRKGGNKKVQKQTVTKRMIDKLRTASKVQALENWAKGIDESRRREATFQANMMFSVNGLVEALCSKRHLNQDLEARAAIDSLISTVIGDDEEAMVAFNKQREVYLEEYKKEMFKVEGPQGPMLLTMDDLEKARIKVIEDYRKEELAAKAAEEQARKEAENKAAAESKGEEGQEQTEESQPGNGEQQGSNGSEEQTPDSSEKPSEALQEAEATEMVPSELTEAEEAPERAPEAQ